MFDTHERVVEKTKVTDDYLIELACGQVYAGDHLLVDLYGAQHLDDVQHMKAAMQAAIKAANATLLHLHLHHFGPKQGLSGVAVLSESHMSVHTWPERGYAAFDVFMCGKAEPKEALPVLQSFFSPKEMVVSDEKRGRLIEKKGEYIDVQ